ncbi:MAG: chorismate mutase [Methanobrevibacter sp.]|nr:chorismate mutase [Candidatus Methanovirga aequatorialis]
MNEKIKVNTKKEAEELLNISREEIDKIDHEILELISKRTKLAKSIMYAKKILDRNIYDEERERVVHENIKKMATQKNMDEDVILKVMTLLMKLSKDTQKNLE